MVKDIKMIKKNLECYDELNVDITNLKDNIKLISQKQNNKNIQKELCEILKKHLFIINKLEKILNLKCKYQKLLKKNKKIFLYMI